MIELRKDYILERWSYIACGRGKRPQETEASSSSNAASTCFFCPGNEQLTPPEIGREADQEGWKVRWFMNKFPAVEPELATGVDNSDSLFMRGEAFGYHEVIVDTPDHDRQLAQLTEGEMLGLLQVYAARLRDLGARDGVGYVQLFKNSGVQGGCSLPHSHTQIVASQLVPRSVQEKLEAIRHFASCPYCEVVRREAESERLIAQNDGFAAFASYAPRFNYEAQIIPKRHFHNLTELGESELGQLAEIFHRVLAPLGRINAPYNFYLHYAPEGEDLHLHFEITPRLNTWAGFELATDSFVITTSPEEAAAFYRE